ncbi:Hpt domain-containing protein [Sunxiuqinia dokdonensis]|uniref:HPt domain-containing protein n=1 Tax=Sunxiuqinia dokdonensis TaxID=1409788 RepID=A0A0L8V3R6_9BACT|nr:Hpt domain-containing protein [Sunxiuqinia dokdonensis]KOH42998.1 hypothetical protein NC99_42140 [Sunxiuqinia dokdonensis]
MTNRDDNQTPDHLAYSVKKIQAFAQGDQTSLRLILDSFIQSTRQNLQEFENLLSERHRNDLAELAHKMRSMFLQLDATGLAQHLYELEENRLNDKQWRETAEVALRQAKELVKTIQADYQLNNTP